MPLAFAVGLSGSVVASTLGGTLTGYQDAPAAQAATVTGSLVRNLIDGYDGRDGGPVWWSWRVKIGAEWVTAEEQLGACEIARNRDSTITTFSFSVRGARWGVFATEKTWTQVAAVEVHYGTSATPNVTESRILKGYITGAEMVDEVGGVVRIDCADVGAKYAKTEVCYELAPFSGLTRGAIVTQVCSLAGITVSVPAGDRYNKPVQLANTRILEWIRDFVEPEGWVPRFNSAGTLVFDTPRLAVDPDPADHSWTARDWLSISITPPRDVPSRWVLRGTSAVEVNELGITTRVTDIKVTAPYAPVYCEEQQNSSGVISSTGYTQGAAASRVVSRILDEQRLRGQQLIGQHTTEWAWYNPAAAFLESVTGGMGPAEGYDYVACFLDPEGAARANLAEKFMVIGHRIVARTYEDEATLASTSERVYRWYRNPQAVRPDDDVLPTLGDAFVYSDGESFDNIEELFGLAEQHDVAYTYDATTGASIEVVQTSSGYDAHPASPIYGHFVTAGGRLIADNVGSYQTVEMVVQRNTIAEDGVITGKTETIWGLRPGGGFGILEITSTSYTIESDEQTTEVTYSEGKRRERTSRSGSPLPLYLSSDWTRMQLEQIDVVIDDPVLEAWFGYQRSVINNDYIQSAAEAEAMLRRELARATSFGVAITRPLTITTMHDTVEAIDPDLGLGARGLVVAIDQTLPEATAFPVATYHLEVPLS